MNKRLDKIINSWIKLRGSQKYKNILMFLSFVGIAALLWVIMSLNENVQSTVKVGINIYDVPDSVTFIDQPPKEIKITVRDKGTDLLRRGFVRGAHLDINFNEFSSDGVLRFSRENLYSGLKRMFGATAQISSVSIDSLRLLYTSSKGKRVPIDLICDVSASSGNVIAGNPKLSQTYAYVFAPKDILDTITRVYTSRILRRNLSETESVTVNMVKISGARIEPSSVKVEIPVEPLVSKTASYPVKAINVPEDVSVLLFPEKVIVDYFVPMSKYNQDQTEIGLVADFASLKKNNSRKLPVSVRKRSSGCVNVRPRTDSLEFTIVR